MENNRRHRAIAAAATLLFHALLIAALVAGVLRYSSEQDQPEWPPADSSEILFGGEFVMVGDQGASEAEAAAETAEVSDVSDVTDVTDVAAPSGDIKVPKAPKDLKVPKDLKDPKAEAEKAEKAEKAEAIKDRVSFGKGKGKAGQPDGNSADGAVSGIAASGLGNRKAVSLPSPAKGPMGKIVVKITVDRNGNVTSAAYLSGVAPANASASARRSCVEAARRSRFSADPDAPASQTGTITYTYK